MKSKLIKYFDKFNNWYLVTGFPFVLGLFIWEYYKLEPALLKAAALAQKDMIIREYSGGWWNYIGPLVIIWFVLAVITIFRLLLSTEYRDAILSKLGRIKERDEREIEITGFASKFSMIASIALLLFLLFFNSFNFEVKKYKSTVLDSDGNPKHGKLTLGFGLKMLDSRGIEYTENDSLREFNYKELPISKTGLIIIMIFWQVGTFHFAARRKLKN